MAHAARLRELGYEYVDKRLVSVDKGEPFAFQGQAHYDQLADTVLSIVAEQLVSEGGLETLPVPVDAAAGSPTVPIYVTPGFASASKVLFLLQGSGRVRAGCWGCALCINQDLDHGTMLPHLRLAKEREYAVVVANPNLNTAEDGQPVPGSEEPELHTQYVWDHVLAGCAGSVDVLAHSNGGRCFLDLLAARPAVKDRVRRVVFTDSYHDARQLAALPAEAKEFLSTQAVNFVPSPEPIGTVVDEWDTLRYHMYARDKGCPCFAAATNDHATTNFASLEATFDFFSKA